MSGEPEEISEFVQLAADDCVIFDIESFCERTGAIAVQMRDGQLFVLNNDLKWLTVESLNRPKGKLSTVPKEPKG